MTGVQAELYEILKIFDGICRKHDLEYFLTGGSALGAIRHNGFIPWDDDIDMGVTRDTWIRLSPILREELPEGFVLVCSEDYPTYRNPVVRIVNTRSARLTRAALADGCPKGQFLEVFIYDPVPKEKVPEHKKLFGTYCELLSPYLAIIQQKFRIFGGLKDDELDVADEYFRIKASSSEDELQSILSQMKEELTRYDEQESDYYLIGWGGTTRYYPIENFLGIRYERFEDMEVPVSIRACANLRVDFRNEWMDYPPPEYQEAPHLSVGVPGISGKEYIELIRREISFDETNAMRLSIKEKNLKGLRNRIDRDRQMIGIRMKLAQSLDRNSTDTKALYDAGKYDEICDRFRSYLKIRKSLLNHTFHEDISFETRQILASSLLMKGRLTEAENVLNIEQNRTLNDDNSDLACDILRLSMSVPCFYDGYLEEAREMLDDVSEEWHSSIPYRKMDARLKIAEGTPAPDSYRLMEEYPDDAEAVKLAADTMMLESREAEAKELYRQILAKSNNGMDVLDIRKRLEA